ncbi:MAG TPA: DUF1684 domain-containing protein [Candidatus Eisenbacteria bacterium]|nr:DUF1684 domain-containing protein [Candidatus Eisenbacteria bacterium]
MNRDAVAAPDPADETADDRLSLADWRRRVADLYSEVRAMAVADPESAWRRWREIREWLFREHPQSPVPAAERSTFEEHHWPYDPGLRFELRVIEDEGEDAASDARGALPAASPPGGGPGINFGGGLGTLVLPISTGGERSFSRIGWLEVPFAAGARRLGLYWMAGYAGGLFLPFRDATNGDQTYGAGRYLLDAAKSADLGGDAERRTLILDFNFSFHPSCAFDPRWSCPLSPPENRLDLPVEAGERLR